MSFSNTFECMSLISRREFLAAAAAMGASVALADEQPRRSNISWRERRDLFPQGVASGDPTPNSVLLWTRRSFSGRSRARLRVEISEDDAFSRVIATAKASVLAASDWTCRVLVGNLQPAAVYWYRFVDDHGNASRVGRTLTAPSDDDTRPVRFAFVSCQNINVGSQHAYRRMIFEDERASEGDRLQFVLHLGDFIYEVVWYPEDNPKGVWGRQVRDHIRYPHGEKIRLGWATGDVHIPTTVEDYRAGYRAYLQDPDIQDARARWPFVCIFDNHEFSASGWQSFVCFNGENRPAQTRKIAANQAWFEYQPARVVKSSGPSLETFHPPMVRNAPISRFDAHGLGDEPNNRAAVGSLRIYRALRWGRHLELLLTDQRSYRSQSVFIRPELAALTDPSLPGWFSEEALRILDAGRAYNGGKPPRTIHSAGREIPNFRESEPPQTYLGAEQKEWFLRRLKESDRTWKVWGNSIGTLEHRADLGRLTAPEFAAWRDTPYAQMANPDFSTTFTERAEVYQWVRDHHITGFASVSGDRHSFWAGFAASSLPPAQFEPVGVAFITGSISMPGEVESLDNDLNPADPRRALFLAQRTPGEKPEPATNMLYRHGARSCEDYGLSRDAKRAQALSDPDLAPHLAFVDVDGHGYSTVRVSSDALECEFVCIPHPIERNTAPDGGQLLYRVVHRAPFWRAGEAPRLEQHVIEGNPALSL